MTILAVVKDVCAAVGVMVPTSIFSGLQANRTMQEMLALANEMAQRMAYDTREWTKLKTSTTFIGDGAITHLPGDPPEGVFRGTSAFNLPANYKRMLLTTNVWRSSTMQQPMLFIPDTDKWMQRRAGDGSSGSWTAAGYVGGSTWGEWTLLGDQMHIAPVMPVGVNASFAYLDKNCVTRAAGGYGDTFIEDGDSYRLDERLLKLNMIWQWKANKGTPYAEDMGTYSDALMMATGADKPAPMLISRSPPGGYSAQFL